MSAYAEAMKRHEAKYPRLHVVMPSGHVRALRHSADGHYWQTIPKDVWAGYELAAARVRQRQAAYEAERAVVPKVERRRGTLERLRAAWRAAVAEWSKKTA